MNAASIVLCASLALAHPALGQPTKPATPASPAPGSPAPTDKAPLKKPPAKPAQNKPTFPGVSAQWVDLVAAADREWTALLADTSRPEPVENLRAIAAWAVAYVPVNQHQVWTEVASRARGAELLAKAPVQTRPLIVALAREHPKIMQELALLVEPERDVVPRVFEIVTSVTKQAGKQADGLAAYIAAIAVVHDRPANLRLNENTAYAAEPSVVMKHALDFGGRMLEDPRKMPARLLVHVVDMAADEPELAWAVERYGKQRDIGQRYKDVPYDNEHLKGGKKKKVTAAGFSLRNCLKGGVCVDQAYFAATVGKSLGVPTVYLVADGPDMGHAWVGWFRRPPGRWDFDTGRYTDYQRVRGSVIDPQTRQTISDGAVAITGELSRTDPAKVLGVQAIARAVAMTMGVTAMPDVPGLTPPKSGPPRDLAGVDGRLGLLEEAVRINAGFPGLWDEVRDLSPRMDTQAKARWASIAMTMPPDFALDILTPLIASEKNLDEQDRLWQSVAKNYRATRPDLVAEAQMHQARAAEQAGQFARALELYRSIVAQWVNQGSAAIQALDAAAKLLREADQPAAVVALYEDAYKRVTKPSGSVREFAMGSNWAQIAGEYQKVLIASGDQGKAEEVGKAITAVLGK